jgi:uncharacterized protein (DUF736 family)
MYIGHFQNAANGRITGEIDALLLGRLKLTFEPNGKGADYRVLTDTGCEVGAAWNKTAAETGKAYISARLDSPFLTATVNVSLFPAKDDATKHVLLWDRPPRITRREASPPFQTDPSFGAPSLVGCQLSSHHSHTFPCML